MPYNHNFELHPLPHPWRNVPLRLPAITGEMELYSMSEIPEWVDYVYSGDEICDLYNSYGSLQKGFINSVIGQKGCTMTTDDPFSSI